jgi:dTDP-4-amino-4,6-dideoxy-D-glucose acyltransferase
MAWLSRDSIDGMGFAAVGENVMLSDRASFYNCAGIGGIQIGNHTHIAVYSSIIGAGKVTLSDFCNISSRVSIYSSNDDYTGASMTNPTVPPKFKCVVDAEVFLGKHVIVGSGTVILPGVTLEAGVAVGALSLVTRDCKAFGIYAGNPARRVNERKRNLLELEQRFLASKVLKPE